MRQTGILHRNLRSTDFGFTHDTLCRKTFKKSDVVALEATRCGFKVVRKVVTAAIDMRATHKQEATIKHLLSVVSHELGITLTQLVLATKPTKYLFQHKSLNKGKVITTCAIDTACFL